MTRTTAQAFPQAPSAALLNSVRSSLGFLFIKERWCYPPSFVECGWQSTAGAFAWTHQCTTLEIHEFYARGSRRSSARQLESATIDRLSSYKHGSYNTDFHLDPRDLFQANNEIKKWCVKVRIILS
jgi:hypothetical protein